MGTNMNSKYLMIAAALVAGFSAVDAQTRLEFDAASLKPAPQTGPTASAGGKFSFYSGCSGGPGTTDTGRFACSAVTLRTLIQHAWNLRNYQLAGPGTLDGTRYDVEAKIPEGTTREQFDQMLQNLLTDRFHLAIHHEEREQEVYELSIGKGGHKLKVPQPGDTESARDALMNDSNVDGKAQKKNPFDDPDLDPKVAVMLSEVRSQLSTRMAARAGERPPSHIATSTVDGLTRLAGRRATIADLVGFLSNQLGKPATDQTQLAGEWNFEVEYASEGRMGNGQVTAAMSQLRQSMPRGGSGAIPVEPSAPSGGQSITAAFQKQLGLKLEATKGLVETVVVDRFDKTPTEN
jgi:uncharacterized protein (TIGR03435 family)